MGLPVQQDTQNDLDHSFEKKIVPQVTFGYKSDR